ncbi:putative acetyltransferase [Kockovaella imperatae]|uniref:Putative acetyltransferase n=1 Tax=Kockovaella imperatae TaxID=4999 RepID=A0A1Y1URB2_9TREE|nr:putative acetyltransferase [Kockovaella imperatae]ORX40137.1 putative acetyltransferase [Kockovaella imperatae]
MTAAGPSRVTIRTARPEDIPAVHEIYSESVRNGTGTFAEDVPTFEEMTEIVRDIQNSKWPFIVAELPHVAESREDGSTPGDTLVIVGYAYVAQFRMRSAYRYCCEDSVYISPSARGQGVGASLMDRLIHEAKACGFLSILAVIGDSRNQGSIQLHRKFGFRDVGVFKEVGLKFGQWLDVVMMQLDVQGSEEKKQELRQSA